MGARSLRVSAFLVLAAAAALAAPACRGADPAGQLRFRNQAPVWRVNDRMPFSPPPVERDYFRNFYHTDGYLVRRITRAMDVQVPRRAADVNSLDEAPDSTWFTNRIGVRELTADEVRRGPTGDDSPLDHLPWKITGAKHGGTALGFKFEDARGHAYLLKLDLAEYPEVETGAHIIVNRILWACGYNVPQDYLGYVRREDLVIEPGALRRSKGGDKHSLGPEDIDEALAKMYRAPDGRYRVLASKLLAGPILGPFAREGRRPDDPNDVFPHERRRPLRGQYPIFAWLNHTDIQEDQTLDVWVKAPGGGGYVMHYILDFGRALGTMGLINRWQTIGYTYRLDWTIGIRSLLSLGLWVRPWEHVSAPALPGVGLYEARHYLPGAWRPNSQYWPFEDKDRFDAYWGSKILIRFTPAQLEAIVDEAQYSHPLASRYILQTLIERQRMTARYWFGRLSPLDNFLVEPGAPQDPAAPVRLCFDDLALAYQLETAPTSYLAEAFDGAGRRIGQRWSIAASGPRTCTPALVAPASADGYTIVKLSAQRRDRAMPPVLVHLAREPGGPLRVIGLHRE